MSQFVGVRVHRVYKIGILNQNEEETFGDVPQDGVVDGQGFGYGGEIERLEFDSRHVIPCESPVFSVAL